MSTLQIDSSHLRVISLNTNGDMTTQSTCSVHKGMKSLKRQVENGYTEAHQVAWSLIS